MVVKAENVLFRPPIRGQPVTNSKKPAGRTIKTDDTFYILSMEEGKLRPIAKALEFQAGVDFASREALETKYPVQMHMDGNSDKPELTVLVSFNDEGRRIMHS